MTSMYVIVLDYVADLSEIDAALDAHRAWLDQHYQEGTFLASGPRQPRTGGVILARGERATIDAAVATDPFAIQGLARHTVIEFHPSRLTELLDTDAIRSALHG